MLYILLVIVGATGNRVRCCLVPIFLQLDDLWDLGVGIRRNIRTVPQFRRLMASWSCVFSAVETMGISPQNHDTTPLL